jgi:hypothetical protein
MFVHLFQIAKNKKVETLLEEKEIVLCEVLPFRIVKLKGNRKTSF